MHSIQEDCDQMIAQQVRCWEVLDARVLEAMHRWRASTSCPPPWRSLAYADCALPLPLGKHMLTPMLAGRMLQALELQVGRCRCWRSAPARAT